MDGGTRPGSSARIGCAAAIVVAWSLLAVQSLTSWHPALIGPGSMGGRKVALCLVTLASAGSCLCRATRRAGDRVAWALLGTGLAGYATGFVLVFFVRAGPGPLGLNISDWVSLPFYPLAFAGLVALRTDGGGGPRGREAPVSLSSGLDGLVSALAAGAVIVALVGNTHASLFHGSRLKLVYALAYPVGSLTLLAGAVTVLALRRWRLEARWVLLVAGFGALAVGDVVYSFRAAAGSFRFGTWLDLVYTAGPALVGLAAWSEPRPLAPRGERSMVVLAVPGMATLVMLAVLMVDHVVPVPGLAVVLAGAGIALSVGRTAMFLRHEKRYERARRDSMTDDLTGLSNRRALERLLALRLAGGLRTALLLVDLDGFKEINDTLGHAAGDVLLAGLAARLTTMSGHLLVARVGGDEFAVVIDGDNARADAFGRDVGRVLEQSVDIDGAMVAVGASVGYATTDGPVAAALLAPGPLRPMSPGELLRRSDVAMYRAKQLRTHFEAWDPTLDVGTRERLETMAAFRAALTDPQQLVVHYQPQFEGRTLRLVGVEALVRWQHPTRGLLGPAEFLPAAETAGLLPAITDRVLDESLTQIASFAAAGHRIPVAVNLSAPDVLDLTFPSRVAAALATHGVDADLLRLEITETVVMTDPVRVVAALERLRDLGARLSLDDYGTGLSSLSYLQLLPVDELKIDRSFVSRITQDPASALIVLSTIDLAHALDLAVVAEGVEDRATLDILNDASCDRIQGFLLGRPVPPADLPALHVPALHVPALHVPALLSAPACAVPAVVGPVAEGPEAAPPVVAPVAAVASAGR